MAEEKNEVVFEDDRISESQEFRNPDDLYQELRHTGRQLRHIRTSSENPVSPTSSIR